MSAFTPTEAQLERIFSAMHPVPGQRFYRRMANAPWQKTRIPSLRFRFAFAAILAAMLFGAFLLATPQGRVLAQQILGYFKTTTQKYLFPSFEPTNTPVATYILTSGASIVHLTPAVDAAQCGATVSPVSSTFPCQLINAESEAGFPIKTFPADRVHLTFKILVVVPELQIVVIHFTAGSAFYTMMEGTGDFPSDEYWNPGVPVDAVRQVEVAGHPAEFVAGGWYVTAWDPDYPAYQLRWKEGNRWFEIFKESSEIENPEKGAEEELIGLAENLVTASQGVERLAGADTPTVSQQAGFTILEPTILPEVFRLCDANYVSRTQTLIPPYVDIHYCRLEIGTTVKSLGSLDIVEVPASEPGELRWIFNTMYTGYVESTKSEDVRIGGAIGQYLINEKGEAVIWTAGDLKLMIVDFWTPSEGGQLGKADLIAIAESMK
jgi:hypothetical protein